MIAWGIAVVGYASIDHFGRVVYATSSIVFFFTLLKLLSVMARVGDAVHHAHDRLRSDLGVARASSNVLGGGGDLAALLADTMSLQAWDILRYPIDTRFVANAALTMLTGVFFALAPTLVPQ